MMSSDRGEASMFSYKEKFETDGYAKIYGDKYIEKIGQLRDILYNESDNESECVFNVFGIEAGLGKSRAVVDLIDSNLLGWENNDNYLIVRKFKSDIIETVNALEEANIFIENVLGLTSDNWSEWREKTDQLKEKRVLVISHKRYLDLCLDDSLREDFIQNRDVLIIDEKMQFPSYSFSKQKYDKLRSYLPISLQKKFDVVCNEFLEILLEEEVRGGSESVVRNIFLDNLSRDEFVTILENNKQLFKESEKNEMDEFSDLIKIIDNTSCIHSKGTISCINPNYRLWRLKKNIILDASAEIDGIYRFGGFNVIGTEKIVDHSNSTFTWFKNNTSKSSMRDNFDEIVDEIVKKIRVNHSEGEKTLIISHKENTQRIKNKLKDANITDVGHGDEYKDEGIALNWFGNIIGNNRYSEFDNCWIIGTPNIPYDEYILLYMFYSGEKLDEIDTHIYQGRFINEQLKRIQEGFIASEIYQSIKRIQRNANPSGKYFIVNHDFNIIRLVSSQIKGSKFIEKELEVSTNINKKRSNDNVQKFIDLINTLPLGKYRKKEICERIDIDSANLGRILKNARVVPLLEGKETGGLGKIINENKNIVII